MGSVVSEATQTAPTVESETCWHLHDRLHELRAQLHAQHDELQKHKSASASSEDAMRRNRELSAKVSELERQADKLNIDHANETSRLKERIKEATTRRDSDLLIASALTQSIENLQNVKSEAVKFAEDTRGLEEELMRAKANEGQYEQRIQALSSEKAELEKTIEAQAALIKQGEDGSRRTKLQLDINRKKKNEIARQLSRLQAELGESKRKIALVDESLQSARRRHMSVMRNERRKNEKRNMELKANLMRVIKIKRDEIKRAHAKDKDALTKELREAEESLATFQRQFQETSEAYELALQQSNEQQEGLRLNVEALTSSNSDLQSKKEESDTKIADLKAQIDALARENAESNGQLTATSAKLRELEAKGQVLQLELTQKQNATAALEAKITQNETNISSLQTQLKDEQSRHKSEISGNTRVIHDRDATITELKGRYDASLSLHTALTQEKNAADSKIKSLKKSLETCNQAKGRRIADIKSLALAATTHKGQTDELEKKQKELTELLRTERERNKELEITISANQDAVARHNDEIQRTKADIEKTNEQVRNLELTNSELKSKIRDQKKLDQQITQLSEELSALKDSIIAQEASIKDLQKQLSDVNAEKAGLEAQIKRLKSEVQAALIETGEAKAQLENIKSELQSCKQKSDSLDSLIIQQSDQIDEKTKEAESNEKKIEELRNQSKERQSTIDNLQSKIQDANAEIRNLREATKNESINTIKLSREIAEKQTELSSMLAEKKTLEDSHSKIDGEMKALQASTSSLQSQIAKATEELEVSKESHKKASETNIKLENELNDIRMILSGKNITDQSDEPRLQINGLAGTINTIRNELGELCPHGTNLDVCVRTLKKQLSELQDNLRKAVTANYNQISTETAKMQSITDGLCNAREDPYNCARRYIQAGKQMHHIIDAAKGLGYAEGDIVSSIGSKKIVEELKQANAELLRGNKDNARVILDQSAQIEANQNALQKAEENMKQAATVAQEKATIERTLEETRKQLEAQTNAVIEVGNTNSDLKDKNYGLTTANDNLRKALEQCENALRISKLAEEDLNECRRVLGIAEANLTNTRDDNEYMRRNFDKMVEEGHAAMSRARNAEADLLHARASIITCAIELLRPMLRQHADHLEPIIHKAVADSVEQYGNNITSQSRHVFDLFVRQLVENYRMLHAIPSESTKSGSTEQQKATVPQSRGTRSSASQKAKGKKQPADANPDTQAHIQPPDDKSQQTLESESSRSIGNEQKAADPSSKQGHSVREPSDDDKKQVRIFNAALIDHKNVDSIYRSQAILNAVGAISDSITRLTGRVEGGFEKAIGDSMDTIQQTIKLYIAACINALFTPSTQKQLAFTPQIILALEKKETKTLELAREADALRSQIRLDPNDERTLSDTMGIDLGHSHSSAEPTGIDTDQMGQLQESFDAIQNHRGSSIYKQALRYLLLLTRVTIDAKSQREKDNIEFEDAMFAAHKMRDDMNGEPDDLAIRIIDGIRSEVHANKDTQHPRLVLQKEIIDAIDASDDSTVDDNELNEEISNAVDAVSTQVFTRMINQAASRSATPVPKIRTSDSTSRFGRHI
jgi:chromosome segregation ATPase